MIAELGLLVVAALTLAAAGFASGVLAGRRDADLSIRCLRAELARQRSVVSALQRELDEERARRAPVLRVVEPYRADN